jgi:hypothetical protein
MVCPRDDLRECGAVQVPGGLVKLSFSGISRG